ncbi:MAG: mechanosensitive ion channel, partial [Planctomycetaceae bacterium]|nr:mechanosensitive ion channel [Planctomycetaceae bacterium]
EALSGIASPGMGRLVLIAFPAVVALALLLLVQQRARSGITECAALAARRSCISLLPTLRALLLTFGVAAEWPLVAVLAGCLCRFAADSVLLSQIGVGLIQFGGISLWLNCWRHAVGPDGVAVVHFGWNSSLCQMIRRWIHLVFLVVAAPLALFLAARQGGSPGDMLERILFIVLMLAMTAAFIRLCLPLNNPFMRLVSSASSLLMKSRWLWAGVPAVFPIGMAALSLLGFHYTAVQLCVRFGFTLVTLSTVLLGHELLNRWLTVSRTRTRLQQARDRAMDRDRQQDTEPPAEGTPSSIPPTQTEEVDIEVFGLQARSLLKNIALFVALGSVWGIWSDVLPALRVLDRETLWYVTETVVVDEGTDGTEVIDGSGDAVNQTLRTEVVRRPVTVGSLLLAAFTLAITIVAVRQLPGLIEVVLSSQSGLDRGARYAVITVTRYVLLLVGMTTFFSLLGLRWTQVQWLAAGLSVGLGFGLQEVFANFVSGIIILLERPVRIGDIVTIDGISGVVSRIRIRATSITDWDRREYIVPNREFVTGKLLNWTLSDTTNRVVIHVGVAYGTNTDLARGIMLEVAQSHKDVMTEPAPMATFEKFGDSALELVLRAYLPNLDNRLQTITELHTEIDRRFAEAGISIPFPQRDVHMYTATPQASARRLGNG